VFPAVARRQTEAVAVRLEAEARKTVTRTKARKARCLTCFAASKERTKREIEPLQRDLRRRRVDRQGRWVLRANRGQRLALIGERDRHARFAMRLDPFFERRVVKQAVQVGHALKRRRLQRRPIELCRHAPVVLVRHVFQLSAMPKEVKFRKRHPFMR